MQLSHEEFDTAERFYEEAKTIGRRGLKQEASALGAKALEIYNQAAVQKIETNTYENKEELTYTDISVPMPVKAGTKIYQLDISLINNSPLAQDILAVLKKYNELGYPGPRAGEEVDLSTMEF